ncbi:MAG: PDZ domain-containing protein, partial [Nitrospinales bacterium]
GTPDPVLEGKSMLPVLTGQLAFAVGSPFGLKNTLTFGIVSGLNRENVNISKYEDFIQTDASINPGNSGGPLVNVHGEIIGINTAIINYAQSIGFSIPSNVVKNVVEHLIRDGEVKRGWLGVGIEPLTNEMAEEAQIKEGGVLVNAVFEGDPAYRAGIRVGDIILKVGNFKVTSPNKMIRIIGAISPGQKIDLDILRKGRRQTVSVELHNQKKDRPLTAALPPEGDFFLGLRVKDFGGNLDELVDGIREGVVVSEVLPESIAERNGLKVGDHIKAINGNTVSSREDFEKAIKNTRKGEKVFMLVTRSGESAHLEMEF